MTCSHERLAYTEPSAPSVKIRVNLWLKSENKPFELDLVLAEVDEQPDFDSCRFEFVRQLLS